MSMVANTYTCVCGKSMNDKVVNFEDAAVIHVCKKCNYRYMEYASKYKIYIINFMWGKAYLLEFFNKTVPYIMTQKDEDLILNWDEMVCLKIFKKIKSTLLEVWNTALPNSGVCMSPDLDPFCLYNTYTKEFFNCIDHDCEYSFNHGGKCIDNNFSDIAQIVDILNGRIYKLWSVRNLLTILKKVYVGKNFKKMTLKIRSEKNE